jgi:hypothetical protein
MLFSPSQSAFAPRRGGLARTGAGGPIGLGMSRLVVHHLLVKRCCGRGGGPSGFGPSSGKLLRPRVALPQKPSAKLSAKVLVSGFSLTGCRKDAPWSCGRGRRSEVGGRLGRGFLDRALSEASEGFLEALA